MTIPTGISCGPGPMGEWSPPDPDEHLFSVLDQAPSYQTNRTMATLCDPQSNLVAKKTAWSAYFSQASEEQKRAGLFALGREILCSQTSENLNPMAQKAARVLMDLASADDLNHLLTHFLVERTFHTDYEFHVKIQKGMENFLGSAIDALSARGVEIEHSKVLAGAVSHQSDALIEKISNALYEDRHKDFSLAAVAAAGGRHPKAFVTFGPMIIKNPEILLRHWDRLNLNEMGFVIDRLDGFLDQTLGLEVARMSLAQLSFSQEGGGDHSSHSAFDGLKAPWPQRLIKLIGFLDPERRRDLEKTPVTEDQREKVFWTGFVKPKQGYALAEQLIKEAMARFEQGVLIEALDEINQAPAARKKVM